MSEFVTFEISKKLKEKGFKEECVAHYYSNDPTCLIKNTALADYVQQPFCIESIKRSWNRCELNPCNSGCYYDVPTISQVMKWLRDEKKIHIGVLYHNYYAVWIQPMKRNEAEHVIHDCKTPEGAELEGIEFVLDNLI